jgi:hypothetical protein
MKSAPVRTRLPRLSAAEKEALHSCLHNLDALENCQTAFEPAWDQDGICGRLNLKIDDNTIVFRVFLHLRITPKVATLILRQMEKSDAGASSLLLADFLPENLAARLRRKKINYVDSCGNAYLYHPPLYVEISGRKRKGSVISAARPFQQAGLKLIFVLLANPETASWTCRRLAAEAGIALGAVSLTLRRLEKTGYLESSRRRKRFLKNPEALLRRWEIGFSENLREKLLLHTCRLSGGLQLTDLPALLREKNLGENVLTGGELGAHLLLDHPDPRSAALHLPGDVLKTMLRLQLVPDSGGNIDIMKIFGPSNTWQGWHPEGVKLADPLLMHADITLRGALSTTLEKKLMDNFLLPRLRTESENLEGTQK